VGYRHSEEEIVDAAAAVALEHGLSGLTYRRVADRLEISDRMVVYYLPTKADLVFAAMTAVSMKLQHLLAEAFGDERRDPDALVRKAWPVLSTPAAEQVFAIFFEAIGLAAARTDPYDQLVPAMMQAWLDWLTTRASGSTPSARRRNALAVIARVDGLLLVRQTLGADASNEAARAQGIRGRTR
jgi:AcrR family transcriptional regulator